MGQNLFGNASLYSFITNVKKVALIAGMMLFLKKYSSMISRTSLCRMCQQCLKKDTMNPSSLGYFPSVVWLRYSWISSPLFGLINAVLLASLMMCCEPLSLVWGCWPWSCRLHLDDRERYLWADMSITSPWNPLFPPRFQYGLHCLVWRSDSIVGYVLGDRVMEEGSVSFSFFDPVVYGILSPIDYFLFVSLQIWVKSGLLVLCVLIHSIGDNILLESLHFFF